MPNSTFLLPTTQEAYINYYTVLTDKPRSAVAPPYPKQQIGESANQLPTNLA